MCMLDNTIVSNKLQIIYDCCFAPLETRGDHLDYTGDSLLSSVDIISYNIIISILVVLYPFGFV